MMERCFQGMPPQKIVTQVRKLTVWQDIKLHKHHGSCESSSDKVTRRGVVCLHHQITRCFRESTATAFKPKSTTKLQLQG